MDKPTKPLAMRVTDAEKELSLAIENISAKNGLPCYILEPLVSNILYRLRDGKRVEVENAEKSYEAEMTEYERVEKENV